MVFLSSSADGGSAHQRVVGGAQGSGGNGQTELFLGVARDDQPFADPLSADRAREAEHDVADAVCARGRGADQVHGAVVLDDAGDQCGDVGDRDLQRVCRQRGAAELRSIGDHRRDPQDARRVTRREVDRQAGRQRDRRRGDQHDRLGEDLVEPPHDPRHRGRVARRRGE